MLTESFRGADGVMRTPRFCDAVVQRNETRKLRAEARAATRTPRPPHRDPYQHRGPRVKRRLRDMPDRKCVRCVCQASEGHSTCFTCRTQPGGAHV